jgi:hypothetical protein
MVDNYTPEALKGHLSNIWLVHRCLPRDGRRWSLVARPT